MWIIEDDSLSGLAIDPFNGAKPCWMPTAVWMILESTGVEALVTCGHCRAIGAVGSRCDRCGRIL